jgi:hypothetical protein
METSTTSIRPWTLITVGAFSLLIAAGCDRTSRTEPTEAVAPQTHSNRFPHFVFARITDPVTPIERGTKYEDPLTESLEARKLGEITGGGTQLDKDKKILWVGIDIQLADLDGAVEFLRQRLRELGAPALDPCSSSPATVKRSRFRFIEFPVMTVPTHDASSQTNPSRSGCRHALFAGRVAGLGSRSHNQSIAMKYIALFTMMAALLIGCGKKEDSIGKQAGEAIGQQLTDFTKGVGKGIDQQMMVQVALSPEVLALGLTNTIAKSLGLDMDVKGISVYFIASKSVSNTLVARAISAEGLEVGRARQPVVMQKDDAAYVTFKFPSEMDSAMVKRYAVGL